MDDSPDKEIQEKMTSGVAWLAATISGKSTILCVVTDDLILKGFKAGELVNEVAQLAGGKGGGNPSMAQAGVKNAEKINDAFASASEFVRKKLAN